MPPGLLEVIGIRQKRIGSPLPGIRRTNLRRER